MNAEQDTRYRLMLAGWEQMQEGADGLGCWDGPNGMRLIQSSATELDGHEWSHVSVSQRGRMPTWEQVRDVFWLIHPGEYGYIVIAPSEKHVNIANVAHAWCRLDGPALPDFTRGLGTI
jgi:hypothetical protein